MPYLRNVLAESLRLYPQPPILIRRCARSTGRCWAGPGCTTWPLLGRCVARDMEELGRGLAGAQALRPWQCPSLWVVVCACIASCEHDSGKYLLRTSYPGDALGQWSPLGWRARPCRALGRDVAPRLMQGNSHGLHALMPSCACFPCRALADDVLPPGLNGDPNGYPIGKGADLFISSWNLHRWAPESMACLIWGFMSSNLRGGEGGKAVGVCE